MTMVAQPVVLSLIEKMDPGTAALVSELVLYEAFWDEMDRIGPALERDIRSELSKRAQRALVGISKGADTPSARAATEALSQIVLVTKSEDDPNTPYWDARGAGGKFIAASLGLDQGKPGVVGERMRSLIGPDADKYSRASTLGRGLAGTGAGQIATAVGELGPEAQRLLEPGIRRTAYRYRGVERRPSAALDATTRATVKESNEQLPGNDQARLAAVGNVGVRAMFPKVPDQELAALSLAAGKLPPSQGIAFDQDGKVITEAHGFNGDHYLPFDLKNLKRFKGGQYVRTRNAGGLTDEDIYTGLMTGTRQMQVVSNSGVFTMEFDPSVRGGRRYSDVARQMVGRYAQLTSTIDAGDAPFKQDIPGAEKAAIRAEFARQYAGDETTASTKAAARIKQLQHEMSFRPEHSDEDIEAAAHAQATKEGAAGRLSPQQYQTRVKDLISEAKADERATMVQRYRLDGEGYGKAMQALQQEFPFFIRSAVYQPLDKVPGLLPAGKPRPKDPGSDSGYTGQGKLGPTGSGSSERAREAYTPKARKGSAPKTADAPATDAKPSAGGAESATNAPTASTAANVPGWAPDQKAPTLQALASGADPTLRLKQGRTVTRALTTAIQLDHDQPLMNAQANGKQTPVAAEDLSDIAAMEPLTYADWLWTVAAGTGTNRGGAVVEFLANPKTDDLHRRKAAEAFAEIPKAMRAERVDEPDVAQAATEASGFVQALGGASNVYAKVPADASRVDGMLAAATEGKPPAFSDITSLGASLANLQAYAQRNPEVAEKAADVHPEDLADHAARVASLAQWGQQLQADPSAPAPKNMEGDRETALNLATDSPEIDPEFKLLETAMKGWTLRATADAVAGLLGEEPPPFGAPPRGGLPGGLDPWSDEAVEQAPREGFVKQLRLAAVDSEVAKAYQAYAKRLTSPTSLSPRPRRSAR